ncbi:MAG: hypothetical protein Q8M40_09605 [Legionella sp.]|nr:hypothetical protein [Legionella sp.]
MNTDNNQKDNDVTAEDYSKAMNFIGQNLLTALKQSVEGLPPQLRNRKVVNQGLSAFLTNVIHKQFPDNYEFCQQMLDELTKLVRTQLDQIPQTHH